MKAKRLKRDGDETFVLVFAAGDEVMAGLRAFAREHELEAAHFTGIGALSDAVLGFFDWERKDYRRNPVAEQVEVVSLIGDVTAGEKPGEANIHAHIVLGRADGTALGGHLLEAHVRPTLEVIVTKSPSHLRRRKDPVSGLALIALETER